jgi:hypothetical protein
MFCSAVVEHRPSWSTHLATRETAYWDNHLEENQDKPRIRISQAVPVTVFSPFQGEQVVVVWFDEVVDGILLIAAPLS